MWELPRERSDGGQSGPERIPRRGCPNLPTRDAKMPFRRSGSFSKLRAMSKTCLILGAKSDIGRALAHRFAKDGFRLYLAGRRAEELEADAADLKVRQKAEASAHEFDALAYDTHEAFYAQFDPAPDVVISLVGSLPEQSDAEKDLPRLLRTLATNFNGCAHILSIAANAMEERKSGTIIGISSVAGDRGRASNYLYGSAKAGFTAFLDGLRNRMYAHGVHVVTVKPGFVYTKMTEGMDLPGPLTAKPEEVANDVFKSYRRKKNILYTKWFWRWIMWIIRNIPEWKFKKMKL